MENCNQNLEMVSKPLVARFTQFYFEEEIKRSNENIESSPINNSKVKRRILSQNRKQSGLLWQS